MRWLAWRQHRMEFLLMGGVLVVCVAFLLLTGLNMAQTFHHLGLGNCLARSADTGACSESEGVFTNQYGVLGFVPLAIAVLVVVFGIFVSAPLVARELEQRTHHLVWTQSITRLRWLGGKLALVLGVSVLMFRACYELLVN